MSYNYEKMVGLERENAKLLDENRTLKEENHELTEKIAKIETYMKKKKFSIPHRRMPAELINELYASMPFGNAFGLLAKMPNGLLARNVQKMINGIKLKIKENKLNARDCGPSLEISEGGFIVKHNGPKEYNCVRAVLPIPTFKLTAHNKPIITFYFEMEILTISDSDDNYIVIDFCDEQFPMQGEWLGWANSNSIGLDGNNGAIWIGGSWIAFGDDEVDDHDDFAEGDTIGLGLIHQPNSKIECFATLNGELLGKATLTPKFVNIELFPAIGLLDVGDRIRLMGRKNGNSRNSMAFSVMMMKRKSKRKMRMKKIIRAMKNENKKERK